MFQRSDNSQAAICGFSVFSLTAWDRFKVSAPTLVVDTGLEPDIISLKGWRPNHLDESTLLKDAVRGFAPRRKVF